MEELLAKYFSGETTEKETNEVQRWRSANESNAKAFLEAKKVWIDTTIEAEPKREILDEIFGESEVKVVSIWKNSGLRIAASIALLIAAISILFLLPSKETQQIVADSFMETTLEDGSIVTLHKGSKLEVSEFGKERVVTLTGKAFFDVKRDETRPFIIHAEEADIRVLGTSFVVNTEVERGEVEVLVRSGLVSLASSTGKNGIEIGKGKMGCFFEADRIEKMDIKDENYLAWKTRSMIFDRSSLSQVAILLEDVYDVDVDFANAKIGDCLLNAKYDQNSLEEVAEFISQTFDIEYTLSKSQLSFSGMGCN